MTMTKTGAAAPSGSQTTTTFQLGTYNAVTDTFTSSIDLNDQATYFLRPGTKQTPNPKLDQKSTAIRADNVRTHGSNIVKDHLDNIIVTAMFSIKSTTEQGVTDAWNSVVKLVKGQQGSAGGTLCLRFCWPKGTAYSYLDIQYAAVQAPPGNPLEVLAKAQTGIGLILEGGYAWRGDRLTYQNLAWNPGFEAPSGAGVTVFSDTFSTVNAYSVQTGSSPTTAPANTYTDVVFAQVGVGNMARYYRLGLADDATHAYDIGGTGQTGTPTASPTQQVAGGVSGDTDTCYTFTAASSQYVNLPTTGLPSGNASITLGIRMKFAANPAANQWFYTLGFTGNHNFIGFFLDSTGKVNLSVGAAVVTSTGALTTGVWHDIAGTWNGTTLTLYVDGASTGTPATPGNQTLTLTNFRIGTTADNAPSLYYNGQLDEAWVASTALGATAIANIRTAGNTGATGNLSNAMNVPAASRIAFGSPLWSDVNSWTIRFRYATSQVSSFYLHYTDANDYMLVSLQSGANGFKLQQDVTASVTTIQQATVGPLQHEAWYWLQITQFPFTLTQFPSLSTGVPYVQAVLSYDNNGAVGTAIATLAGSGSSGSFGVTAKPQIATSGAALVISGLSTGAGHSVSLFGPGAWQFTPLQGSATCTSSGAWDKTTANVYSGGPVASFRAARIDLGPTGTVDCQWYLYNGTTSTLAPTGLFALPIASTPATVGFKAQVKTSGLGNACVTRFDAYEYDSSGAYLRTTAIGSITGNSSGGTWQQVSASITTGSSTAYLGLVARVVDTNANASANGIVWFENVLVWDQTATGTQSMEYCELRFPQSPAQLALSGLQGNIEAPTLAALGTYTASLPGAKAMVYYLGRRAQVDFNATLIGAFANAASNFTPVLDTGSYGGVYMAATVSATALSGYPLSQNASFIQGVYHLFGREKTSQSGGNLGNLTTQISSQMGITASGGVSNADIVNLTLLTNPFSVTGSNLWTCVDHSQVTAPLGSAAATTDLTTLYQQIQAKFIDSTGGGSTWYQGATWLLPTDGGCVTGTLWNGSSNAFSVTNAWLWTYWDGLVTLGGDAPALGFTADSTTALTAPTRIIMGSGTSTGTSMGLNPGADPFLQVNPLLNSTGANGVNQLVAAAMDTNTGGVGPIALDLTYTPLWRAPR